MGQTGVSMEDRENYMHQASARSMAAYREIQRLTDFYNNSLAGGKWKGMMNMMPRDLYVFYPPTLPYMDNSIVSAANYTRHSCELQDAIARNASDYSTASTGCQAIQMLGHSMNAVSIPKGCEVTYEFSCEKEGDALLYTAMIPTQPNDKGDLRYQVTIDNQQPVVISLKEKFRSEFWKQSVLRGQALKRTPVKVSQGHHKLCIKALDDHIMMDQWMLDFKLDRKFYVIPVNGAHE
jgi:hypothetical protein